jgi:hypothetical protein
MAVWRRIGWRRLSNGVRLAARNRLASAWYQPVGGGGIVMAAALSSKQAIIASAACRPVAAF